MEDADKAEEDTPSKVGSIVDFKWLNAGFLIEDLLVVPKVLCVDLEVSEGTFEV